MCFSSGRPRPTPPPAAGPTTPPAAAPAPPLPAADPAEIGESRRKESQEAFGADSPTYAPRRRRKPGQRVDVSPANPGRVTL